MSDRDEELSPHFKRMRRWMMWRSSPFLVVLFVGALWATRGMSQPKQTIAAVSLLGLGTLISAIAFVPATMDQASKQWERAINSAISGEDRPSLESPQERQALLDRVEQMAEKYPKAIDLIKGMVVPLIVGLLSMAGIIAGAVIASGR